MGILSTTGKLAKKALKAADVGMTATATQGATKELAAPATKRDWLDIAVNPGLNAATVGTEKGIARGAGEAAVKAGAWGSKVLGGALTRAAGRRAAGGLAARALGGMAARAGTAAAVGARAGAYAPLAISAAFAAGETANTIKGAVLLHKEKKKQASAEKAATGAMSDLRKAYPEAAAKLEAKQKARK